MDKKLKNLRKDMISSELKEVKFENKHKQNIFEQINIKKRRSFTNMMPRILSVVAVFSVILFLGILINNNFNAGHSPNPNNNVSQSINQKEKEVEEKDSEQKIETLSKEEVHLLMLNTVDHFDTVEGEFRSQTPYETANVEYTISLLEGQLGGNVTTNSKFTQDNTEYSDSESVVFNEKEFLKLNHDGKEYLLSEDAAFNDNGPITLEEVYGENDDGEPVSRKRGRPRVGYANNSVFPYEIATNFLKDYEEWEIEKQSADLLDRKVIVIKGTLDEYSATKTTGSAFKFWVDRQTGILLKKEIYNEKDEVVDYLETDHIKINQKVDNSTFSIEIPDGYSEDQFEWK
ncbi:sigma E regulatory protein, MucB/RseB [Gracilibacillus orientalis]|uniref:Sigma E regulatory protein, MucB/RseB n=1 Tax=Gracilibacillus orientalis TaxID=334253 RepID=A0A1I4MF10_9BACI|nr:hypothetical protein [Gracilibacillus orientalis]SFM01819.1 sigma E regulatory protein, MucB/RseB [Gracilibacillus orientalis]